jgi:hypothetical protein
MEDTRMNSDIFAAMQLEKPYKTYIKTVLGKVCVTVLNPFDETPEVKFLKGNPKKSNEIKGCIVHVWNEKGDAFFRAMNERHFDKKFLAEYKMPTTTKAVVAEVKPKVEEKPYTEWSDDELFIKVLSLRYAAFTPILKSITETATLFRLVEIANANDISVKYIRDIKARIADVQAGEFGGEEA